MKATQDDSACLPLHGVRVIEFCHMVMGPTCGMILADMGADVRNGPTRLRESPYEWQYQRRKAHGDFEDVFSAPTYA